MGRENRAVIQQVHRLFNVGTVAGLSEAQLLDRFVSRGDEASIAAVVARHGPMVLGVCRRLLDDSHDVEDAFQATFLVLVRKAGSLRERHLLGPWLHGVAHRVASRARTEAARRRARERQGLEIVAEDPVGPDDLADLKAVLDGELLRLPEKYRAPIVLCYFEGCSNEDAAQRLGCPVGTVRSRLTRARERLRRRLTRLGLAPSAVVLGAGVSLPGASAAVFRPLLESTVLAALTFKAGRIAALGLIPATVLTLTDGVLTTMFLTKLKLSAAGLILSGGLVAGVLAQDASPAGSRPPTAEAGRLNDLERKLDHVLQVLERMGQPSGSTTRPASDLPDLPGSAGQPSGSTGQPGSDRQQAQSAKFTMPPPVQSVVSSKPGTQVLYAPYEQARSGFKPPGDPTTNEIPQPVTRQGNNPVTSVAPPQTSPGGALQAGLRLAAGLTSVAPPQTSPAGDNNSQAVFQAYANAPRPISDSERLANIERRLEQVEKKLDLVLGSSGHIPVVPPPVLPGTLQRR